MKEQAAKEDLIIGGPEWTQAELRQMIEPRLPGWRVWTDKTYTKETRYRAAQSEWPYSIVAESLQALLATCLALEQGYRDTGKYTLVINLEAPAISSRR